jgi:hypothetical protein
MEQNEDNRFSSPNPKNGIGRSSLAAIAVCLICIVAITVGGIKMALTGETNLPEKEPTYSGEVFDPTDPSGPGETTEPTDPSGPGTSTETEDVVRELTEAEKADILFKDMFKEFGKEAEKCNTYVNNDCVIEVDGQEVEAIKLMYEAKITREDGLVDYRIVSIATEKTEENKDMSANELAVLLFDQGESNMVVKNDVIEGEFELGEDVIVNNLEGSKALRDNVKDGKTITNKAYEKLDFLRKNLCDAAGSNHTKYKSVVTDFYERDINAEGDMEYIIMFDVYDLDGKLVKRCKTTFACDAEFRDSTLHDEILSGSKWDFSLVAETVQVDRNGNTLEASQELNH